jgi:hypothetical protein
MSGIINQVGSKSGVIGKTILASNSTPYFIAYGDGGDVSVGAAANVPFNQVDQMVSNNGWDTSNYWFVPPTDAEGLWAIGASLFMRSASAQQRWKMGDQSSVTDGYYGDVFREGTYSPQMNETACISSVHPLHSGSQIRVMNNADGSASRGLYINGKEHSIMWGVFLG